MKVIFPLVGACAVALYMHYIPPTVNWTNALCAAIFFVQGWWFGSSFSK